MNELLVELSMIHQLDTHGSRCKNNPSFPVRRGLESQVRNQYCSEDRAWNILVTAFSPRRLPLIDRRHRPAHGNGCFLRPVATFKAGRIPNTNVPGAKKSRAADLCAHSKHAQT
jgi:hypothetical protein